MLVGLFLSSILQYRFNATSHPHASNRTPLAKCSNSIDYVIYGLELELKKTSSEQFNKLKMIIRVLIVKDYKHPPIVS